MEGDMHGFGDKEGSFRNWKQRTASNPHDKDNFDAKSMFNKFKFNRHWIFEKKKKIYKIL